VDRFERSILETVLELAFRAAGDPSDALKQKIREKIVSFQQEVIRHMEWEYEQRVRNKPLRWNQYRYNAIRKRFLVDFEKMFGGAEYSRLAFLSFTQTFERNASNILYFYNKKYFLTDKEPVSTQRINNRHRIREMIFGMFGRT
jgi:hypothetical protein